MSNAVISDWPSGSANTGWPQEPTGMLMPGRVEGWPAGTQRAANAAERLLSQAVAWWDVGQYREGDRFLRNRGTGGELLDLRLGSAAVANSNDPQYLAPEDSGYVYLPSATSNRLEVAHDATFNATDLDVRLRVSADSWRPAITRGLIIRGVADPDRAFHLTLQTSGTLKLDWYPLGTIASLVAATSSSAVTANDGDALWVRVTLDVDNGASPGKYEVKFFTSADGVSWTQLGNTITGASTTNLPSVTGVLAVSNSTSWTGKVYRVQLMSGIDGTIVLDIDCDAITSGSAASFTAGTGQTVTITRSTSGRKSVAVPSRHKGGRPVMLLGTDDFLTCVDDWQHGLLNFEQGDSLTVLAVVRQWATQPSASALVIKKTALNSTAGWALYQVTTSNGFIVADGTINPARTTTATLGTVGVMAGIRDAAADTLQLTYNGVAGATTTDTTTTSLGNANLARVGSSPGGNFADMEFFAAAIFRRALTAAEIRTISNYFTGRIA